MLTITQLHHPSLEIDSWKIAPGDSWCVLGRNGSGKQLIDKVLTGTLKDVAPSTIDNRFPEDTLHLVSFETQQAVYEREMKLAANDLLADDEPGTRAADFLPADKLDDPLVDTLHLRHRLESPYRLLSTGESRKLLVARAILTGARCLVLDNPFDSLDPSACAALSSALSEATHMGIAVILLLSNRQDIPEWCGSIALVAGGIFKVLGKAHTPEVDAAIANALSSEHLPQPDWPESALELTDYPHAQLVFLNSVNVSFGGSAVLRDITLSIAPLQHTLITGDNGAGKSTLLGLITGDCPQCFSNDVTVLGHRRGSGESVWDLKHHMGIVSNDLHRRYRVNCTALTAVCSGFFDSIGVYDAVNEHQQAIARQWLAAAGLAGREQDRLQSMSYGEQRLVLIARALVKSPLLLVLDEPTQGLDEINRQRVMDLLETLDRRRHSTVVFVSHRRDEHLPLFRQHLHLQRL